MLTTCPECRTTFRLSHSQLEARRGLVRCGYCRAVFNAYDTLLPEFEAPGAVPPEPATAPNPPPSAEPVVATDSRDLDQDVFPSVSDDIEDRPEADRPDAETETEPEPDSPEDEAFVLHLSERVDQEMPQFGPPPAMPFPEAALAVETPEAILLSELPTRAQIEPDRQTGKRILFALLSLFLLLALFAQGVYFLRGPLATWMPELRPGLEAACAELGCRIPVASELSAIRVESSSLETDPEQANRAMLRVSFSNRSSELQQWPHFVLKLTDWQGGPLAQRAFAPVDYLAKDKAAQAGMAPMSEQEFHLDLDLGGLSASGYEVFPKYP